ncbi:hypothetical protein CLUG_01195 [Clavispora lusitaniae ATCC 42720]|uniref:Uncharacterized protein n=1 Tax=Clavispora lusitaniae (strain ATCC 42720) TaxID=306902 RepID=C4XZ22_CLAL4|nr:uncharacterized protein CLUG_01195 [Clavispora lusitaniae ATCC 42720]EEQ37072.1 hypothetical protein CLUG_01195 [Clavispora lusitaniae ATCC 42720]
MVHEYEEDMQREKVSRINEVHQSPCRTGSNRPNDHHLKTFEDLTMRPTVVAQRYNGFHIAEYEQRDDHYCHGNDESGPHNVAEEVWYQWNKASKKVTQTDGQCRGEFSSFGGLVQTLPESDDEINEIFWLGVQVFQKGDNGTFGRAELKHNSGRILVDQLWFLEELQLFLLHFTLVVIQFTLRGQVATKTHGNSTGNQLCQTTGDNKLRRAQRGQSGRQCKWNSQSVRKTNNDVTHHTWIELQEKTGVVIFLIVIARVFSIDDSLFGGNLLSAVCAISRAIRRLSVFQQAFGSG